MQSTVNFGKVNKEEIEAQTQHRTNPAFYFFADVWNLDPLTSLCARGRRISLYEWEKNVRRFLMWTDRSLGYNKVYARDSSRSALYQQTSHLLPCNVTCVVVTWEDKPKLRKERAALQTPSITWSNFNSSSTTHVIKIKTTLSQRKSSSCSFT